MNIFKQIWSKLTWKSDYSKNLDTLVERGMNIDGKLGWNIYDYNGSRRNFTFLQNLIHKTFKYKFLYLILIIGQKILGDKLVDKVPNKSQFDELKIFDESFEEALILWKENFRCCVGNKPNTRKKPYIAYLRYKDSIAVKQLRLMKQFTLTICKNDTTYLEFLNMLIHRITINTNQLYDKEELHHLLYTSKSVNDVKYYVLHNSFKKTDIKLNSNHFRQVNPRKHAKQDLKEVKSKYAKD